MLPISVCMPVYNRAKCIGECIESILQQTFTDFELLIVDDGSTDETCDIILSYDDPRIRLIRGEHDYIGSCNRLFDEAQGKYIARMDSDDLMLPDRLRIQYEYMDTHPEVDILGGGIITVVNNQDNSIFKRPHVIGWEELLQETFFVHPTVMMRRESIMQHGLRYDADYIYAEDFHFWFQALRAGLQLRNIDDILLKYRISDEQVTAVYNYKQKKNARKVQSAISRWIARDEEVWAIAHPVVVPESPNSLTVIIPFLNEGEEVVNTVRSIRKHVGDRVDIMVINDQSNDGYNYRSDLASYNVIYIYNIERKGVAASRDYGVELCRTPFFLLLDGHMRFYSSDWVDKLTDLLEADDRRLLCCQTDFLQRDKDGIVSVNEECPTTYGACIRFDKRDYYPSVDWLYSERNPEAPIESIPIVLGAGYAASKRYWQRIGGLRGLRSYGCDEVYMSLKVWMEGGECLLLKDVVIGHVYRKGAPYTFHPEDMVFNYLFISRLLLPQSLCSMAYAVALHHNRQHYAYAVALLNESKEELEELRDFYSRVLTKSFKDVQYMHKRTLISNEHYYNHTLSRLAEIAENLKQLQIPDCGLYEGKASLMFWMCHYAHYTGCDVWDELAAELYDNIESAVFAHRLPWNFGYGLCGIGWVLFYLYEHQLLDELPRELIDYIDHTIETIDATLVSDFTFATGLGGLYAYVVQRLRSPMPPSWSDTFLHRLDDAAQRLLSAPQGELPAIYQAVYYLSIRRDGTGGNDLPLSLDDWLDTTLFVPANVEQWKYTLNGVVGASLMTMIIENNRKKH